MTSKEALHGQVDMQNKTKIGKLIMASARKHHQVWKPSRLEMSKEMRNIIAAAGRTTA